MSYNEKAFGHGKLHEPNAGDRQRAERFARMVQIRIEQRHWAAAHAAVDAAERACQEEAENDDRVALGTTSLEVRTVNTLEEEHGVLYVDELAAMSVDDLVDTPNIGEKMLGMINKVLFEHGFDQKWPGVGDDAA